MAGRYSVGCGADGSGADFSDDVMTDGLSGGADRVRHGEWSGSPVTDDADAVHPEQRGAAIRRVIRAAADAAQGRREKEAGQLQPGGGRDLLLDHAPKE